MSNTLTPILIVSPIVEGDAVSVDVDLLPFTIDAGLDAVGVEFILQETGQTIEALVYETVGLKRRFSANVPVPSSEEAYHLTIRAKNSAGNTYTQVSPNVSMTIIRSSDIDVEQALPPMGVSVQRLVNILNVKWQKPLTEGFLGVRVLTSSDPTGITVPFTQRGNLVAMATATQRDTLTTATTYQASDDGLHKITTVDNTLVNVPYSQVTFIKSQVANELFYVMLTSVVQDPLTHHIHESYGVGPFECTFVDLRSVLVTDFPSGFTPEDIAVQLIANISQAYPQLDLTPRSELRDTLIDPVSMELALASTRQWFANVSQCVEALAQIDDADGDGMSDDPGTNTFKQALANAFRLSNDQVQSQIDMQFDVLGARAGVTRWGVQASTVDVSFYLLEKPTKRYTISAGAIVNTIPDDTTPSLSFKTLGSAVIDPSSSESYYVASRGRWEVTLPCLCMTEGALGNVGAGTVRTVVAGTSAPILCTNPTPADFGMDGESNSSYASRIVDRLVVGIDTGRRLGYQAEARKAFGVIDAQVVASGDLEMLRDWDPLRQKHVFGTVDVYVRGRSIGQEVVTFPYLCTTSGTAGDVTTYLTMRALDTSKLKVGFESTPLQHATALIELAALRTGASSLNFFFGVQNAIYDPTSKAFYLDPEELTYTVVGDTIVFGSKNSAMFSTVGSATLKAMVSWVTPLSIVPKCQPVTQVYSVSGQDGSTGSIPPSSIVLVKTDDPMLEGGSSKASDMVSVDNIAVPEVRTLVFDHREPDIIDLGEGISQAIGTMGVPNGLTAVRSLDATILYAFGTDYSVISLGQHGHFGLKRLPAGSIPIDTPILVTLDVYRFREHLSLRTDTLLLVGSVPTPLSRPGLIRNIQAPLTHKMRTLVDDPAMSSVVLADRYIKVTFDSGTGAGPVVMKENVDFALAVDPNTKQASISRYTSSGTVSSRISDGASIEVSYYVAEMFTVTTRYPQFIQQITQGLDAYRHAAADVLVKAMTENLVDIDLTVDLSSGLAPEIADRKIRTVISAAHTNAVGQLTQSEIVRQIKALPGVLNVHMPFRRMAKADGGYDIGLVIPVGTTWIPMSQFKTTDPAFGNISWAPRTFISKAPVLRYKTLSSGGLKNAYVGMLYEGEPYVRKFTLAEAAVSQGGSFYIIGVNDRFSASSPVESIHYGKIILTTPTPSAIQKEIVDPGQIAYRLTYQVFGDAGAHDIPIGPMEYLRPGKITLDYMVGGALR